MMLNTLVSVVIWPKFKCNLGQVERDADKRIPERLRIQLLLAYAHPYLAGIGLGALYFMLHDKTCG